MNKKIKFNISLLILSTLIVSAGVNGVVYQDLPVNNNTLNTYGEKDVNELGIKGVRVTAYPSQQTTTTDVNGKWSLPITSKTRIEFTNLPTYLNESPLSSSIQFLKNGEQGNLALHDSTNYSITTQPDYVTNLQQNGQSLGQHQSSIEVMNYSNTGLNANYSAAIGSLPSGPAPRVLTTIQETGSIWGKAIQKDKIRLFASTLLQRHIGFAFNKPASEVFVINYETSTLIGSFDLQGKIPTNGGNAIDLGMVCRDLSCINTNGRTGIARDYLVDNNRSQPNIDLDAFEKVGKVAYGDISFDEHTNKLWLINLNQRALISLDATGDFNSLKNARIEQYPLDTINKAPVCIGGILRPWAIKIHHDKIYVGAVCDASTSQKKSDLKAYVLSTSTLLPKEFKEELKIDLDYDKDGSDWNPWSDIDKKNGVNWKEYIQPVLSNIEFDKENNMYLSFLDRYGLQAGYINYAPESNTTDLTRPNREKTHTYGEIFKVCNNNNVYELEGDGNCTQVNYPISSEFFNDMGGSRNSDAAMGSISILSGSNQILATIIDPHPEGVLGKEYWNTLGTSTFNLNSGAIDNWYSNIYSANINDGYNGKSQGMGEIEILAAPSPIEIGNRIWLDSDADGIQDANETGIKEVKIDLICDKKIVASTLTNENGNYLFSNDPHGTSTLFYQYDVSELLPNKNNCSINIPNIKGNNQQAVLGNLQLSPSFIGEGNNSSQNDSNAHEENQSAIINILASDIPYIGANNHSFDIGFQLSTVVPPVTPPVTPPVAPPVAPPLNRYTLGDRVWLDSNRNGIQDSNESGVNGITVTLYNNNNCLGTPLTSTTTSNDGNYLFNNLLAGDYCITFTNLPTDHNVSLSNQAMDNTNRQGIIKGINLTANNNSQDMGIFNIHDNLSPTVVLATTTCNEMRITDNTQAANQSSAITTIDVLGNDTGSKLNQQIKLLSPIEGKKLWEDQEATITSVTTFDTLTIANEGTWRVVNNKVIFTALQSFDGQIPTPIYYIIEGGNDCTLNTQYSNVASIRITTACTCPSYETKPVSTYNVFSILFLIIMTYSISLYRIKEEF